MSYITRRTITYSYITYEPGDEVVSTSPRCPLKQDRVYKVTRFYPPPDGLQHGVVYLEGERYGVVAEYIRQVGNYTRRMVVDE